MQTPNRNGFHGDAMYQAHFIDGNSSENNATGGTHSRFFGAAANPPSCPLVGNSAPFSPCIYMVCANDGTPATYMTPQAVQLPQPQSQPTFVVGIADGQVLPLQQAVLAAQAPVVPSPLLLAEGLYRSSGDGGSVNFATKGESSAETGERNLSPLPPPPPQATTTTATTTTAGGFLAERQVGSPHANVSSDASSSRHVTPQQMSFACHFSGTSVRQNKNNFVLPDFGNNANNGLGLSQNYNINNSSSNNNYGNFTPTDNNNTNNNNNNDSSINNNSNNQLSEDVSGEPRVEVYSPDFTCIISLPSSAILHRPPPSLGVSRLILCRKYVPGCPDSCWKGNMCKFVHADPTDAPRFPIHVNYSWRSVERCAYPRLPPGETIVVLAPNGRQPAETFPSERILVTRGSLNRKSHVGPLSRCAHYYFNRVCNRSENCNFIHTIHVDPTIDEDFKRAPASTSIAPIKKKTSRSKRAASTTSDVLLGTTKSSVNDTDSVVTQTTTNTNAHALDLTTKTTASPNQNFYLAVPQNGALPLSRSLSSVGGGSAHSSTSGETNPVEWSFVDNLDSSIWHDGDIVPQF